MKRVCALLLALAVSLPAADAAADSESLAQLVTLKRVYVERLSGGETADQIRDMIMSSLQNARLFVVTENQERADAILRGSAEDLVFTDVHSSSDSLHASAGAGTGSTSTGSGSASRSQRGPYSSLSVGDSETSHIAERRHEASAAVRLVSRDGDVIWSTTQESMGGKFRGASADVADKITRRLVEDYDRAKKMKP